MLNVFILINHCLGHLSNIERRGQGGGHCETGINLQKLAGVPDVLSGIVAITKILLKRRSGFFLFSVTVVRKWLPDKCVYLDSFAVVATINVGNPSLFSPDTNIV